MKNPKNNMSVSRIDLEAKVAFLERTLDALSEELHQHTKTLNSLEQRLARFERSDQARGSEPEVGPHDAPPPHY